MYSNKEKTKMRSRIAEINLRFEELATTLEKEKRELSKGEKEERNALVSEKEILQLRLERSEHNPPSQQEISQERAFGQAISAIYRNQDVPEETRSLIITEQGKFGFDVPLNRDIQDTASVSPVIPLTIGEIIQPLEKGLILHKLGMKFQYGMSGAWQFPIVAGVEATLEGENVEVSDTKVDISKIEPKPKRVSLAIPVSNRAIDQSSDAILEIVRTQIPKAVARLLNKWMFSPTKITAAASDGCFVNPKTKLTDDEITWDNVVALEGSVMSEGVEIDGTGAYVCTAKMYAKLKTTKKDAGSGIMLLENGMMNGYPVFITEFIGEGKLGFGIFSYELVGQFGKVRLLFDPYTGAKKNLVYFVFNTDYDMLTLRAEAFGTLTIE